MRLSCLLIALAIALPLPARAIPPFARRYGMACTTCHAGGPTKLSTFGEAFRDLGYQMPGGDAPYLREEPLPLGDPSRTALFPNTVWPGELPANLPVGLYATIALSWERPADPAAPAQLRATPNMALVFGATFGEHLVAYGALFERGFAIARGLFDRWLGPNALNLKIGRMDIDWFPVQPQLRRAIQLPLALSLTVGKDGFFPAAGSDAVELYGLLGGRVKWVIGAARGFQPIDAWVRPDLFVRISTRLGGERMDYRGQPTPSAASASAPTVAIGVSGYYGLGAYRTDPTAPPARNEILRLAGDFRLRVGGLDVMTQVVIGSDSDPTGAGTHAQHLAWLVEAEYAIFPWLIPYARFEEALFSNIADDRQRVVAGCAIFIRTNVRVRLEGVIGTFGREPSSAIGELFFAM